MRTDAAWDSSAGVAACGGTRARHVTSSPPCGFAASCTVRDGGSGGEHWGTEPSASGRHSQDSHQPPHTPPLSTPSPRRFRLTYEIEGGIASKQGCTLQTVSLDSMHAPGKARGGGRQAQPARTPRARCKRFGFPPTLESTLGVSSLWRRYEEEQVRAVRPRSTQPCHRRKRLRARSVRAIR